MADGTAFECVGPGSIVAFGDGVSAPVELLGPLSRRAADVGGVTLVVGWSLAPMDDLDPSAFARIVALMGGYAVSPLLAAGQASYLPVRFGALPALLATGLRPDVLVSTVVERSDGFHFATDVSWQRVAVDGGASVVAVSRLGPSGDAGPAIPLHQVVVAGSAPAVVSSAPPPVVTDTHRVVAEHVISLIAAGGRVQYAPGALGEAVLDALRVPVHLDTGVLTDVGRRLDQRGLMHGQPIAPYSIGGAEMMEWVGERRCLSGVEVTHNCARLADGPPLFAVNTALRVDHFGQVNVEQSRGRVVAGIGGQPDYMAAATASREGLSIVALPTTFGGQSTLVEAFDGAVSTPSHDVDVVVTERGAAHLRGLDRRERARALRQLWGA
jgi:hypothetical protein